jgi:cytochrome c2
MLASLFAVVTAMAGYHYAARGFRRLPAEDRFVVPAADPERGRAAVREHGCVACHTVPGVPGASGRVGPRLDRLREQAYIAGVLANSPQNMVRWIREPKEVDPRTAMPNLGVGEGDARDIAAYLYALR